MTDQDLAGEQDRERRERLRAGAGLGDQALQDRDRGLAVLDVAAQPPHPRHPLVLHRRYRAGQLVQRGEVRDVRRVRTAPVGGGQ
ncbi:hypothetical protein [Phytohabitans rumicis]|uniref:hypothetical protein n=1 Tax=Phytohabitans rumicis TaxID=1076125 RepID=UPI0015655B67|nr:hypothetical protein [Phytohabitans rumicis]